MSDGYIDEYILRDTETSQIDIMYECRCSCGKIFYATSTELHFSYVVLCGDCLYEIYKDSIDDDDGTINNGWVWAQDV